MTMDKPSREFARKKRVADMLVTAHSILGERYRKISVGFDIALMLISFLILLGSVSEITSPHYIGEKLGYWAIYSIPVGAALIFVLSVVEWRISWKQKSEAHFSSAREYSSIKGETTALLSKGFEEGDLEAAKIEDRYDRLARTCVQIPHDKFVRLKRAHARKVALSKLLDSNPFAVLAVLRIRLAMKDTGKGWKSNE